MSEGKLFYTGKTINKEVAFVGENAFNLEAMYESGFFSATMILLDSLLSPDYEKFPYTWLNDNAIYPILFNARHAMEIFIKQKINELNKLKSASESSMKTHKLSKLWEKLKELANEINNNKINKIILELNDYIYEFDRIDLTGETFRYAYSNKDEMHLKEIGQIDLKNFRERFIKIMEICKWFDTVMFFLIEDAEQVHIQNI